MTTPHDAAHAVMFDAVTAALALVNPALSVTYDRTIPQLAEAAIDESGAEVRVWLNWRPSETTTLQQQMGDGRGLQTLMAAGDLELIAVGPDGDGAPSPRDVLMGSLLADLAARLAAPRVIELPPGNPCGATVWLGWAGAALALTDDRSPLAAIPQIAARGVRLTLTFTARSALEAA